MGGNPSKESSEVLRNRRLKEFEEEFVISEDGADRVKSPPIRDSYFSQFMNHGLSGSQTTLRSHRGDGDGAEGGNDKETEDDLDLDSISISSRISKGFTNNRDRDRDRDAKAKARDSEEVDEVIAELEETFKTLEPEIGSRRSESGKLAPQSREFSRSQSCGSCGPLTQGMGMPLGISQQVHGEPGLGDKHERRDTPMAAPYGYTRHRRPLGLAHLSRSSGFLGANGDLKGVGASSAPPGVSNLRENSAHWEPPEIEGFDIEKFREANRPQNPIAISVRLPSSSGGHDSDEDPHRKSKKTSEKSPASYTNDEMELLRNLEREVY